MKRVSEHSARRSIALMRSIANTRPISPFHLAVADEMESLLNELVKLRQKLKEKE